LDWFGPKFFSLFIILFIWLDRSVDLPDQ
jgi:hypothetical protein